MKNLLTSLLLIVSIACTAQTGIHFGTTTSWFAGPGVKYYQGIALNNTGFVGGLYHDSHFNKHWGLHTELNYLHLGAKNPAEGNILFSTYHINVPIELTYTFRSVSLMGGLYANKLIYARNHSDTGDGFGWQTCAWDYYRQMNYGVTGGFSINFVTCKLQVNTLYSIRQIRKVWYGDPKYWKSHDQAVQFQLVIPFETFKLK